VAAHLEHDLLVAAHASFVRAEHFDLPALLLGVARIHAEQVAGENAGLVAARPRADFYDHVLAIARIFGEQHPAQAVFHLGDRRFDAADLLARQSAHIGVIEQRLGLLQLVERLLVAAR